MPDPALLLNLFWSFFKVGLFSFGGGYAMIPLMQAEIIVRHSWLTAAEFVDIIAIAETTPGPIAINSATYVGFRIAGIIGSTAATVGVVLPSLLILLITGTFLLNTLKDKKPPIGSILGGVQPAIVVLVLLAAVSLGKTALIDGVTSAIAIIIFLASTFFKANPFYLFAAGALLGLLLYPY